MPIDIKQPPNLELPVGQPILLTAEFSFPDSGFMAAWTTTFIGGSFSLPLNTPTTSTVVYTPPPSITTGDGTNLSFDRGTITVTDPGTMRSDDLPVSLTTSPAALNCTVKGAPHGTDGVIELNDVPLHVPMAGGPATSSQPTSGLIADVGNMPRHPCDRVLTISPFAAGEGNCVSCSPTRSSPGASMPKVNDAEGQGSDVTRGPSMVCNLPVTGFGSQIDVSVGGAVRVKSGCGVLPTRGESLELCTYFMSFPDAFANAEAGIKRSFGWQVKLVIDGASNVALYWGDRRVEAWVSSGGGAFVNAPGTFGTLTQQGDGSYTRTTKDCVYYDFNSSGLLQTIKDRSLNGNVIYYNYNGSSQVIRITGPGMGFKPYFTYNAGNRINSMTLEGSDPAKERVTYYDYDASGRMNKMIAPEGCITYFDYNASNSLAYEIDPDNYVSYFTYEGAPFFDPPRLTEIGYPEGIRHSFGYDDMVPRQTRTIVGCETHYYDYDWSGQSIQIDQTYWKFDPNGKPILSVGTDGGVTYWQWDANGQMTSLLRGCDQSTVYFTYGDCGTVTSYKDELARVTYWDYDSNNLQVDWKDAKGNASYFERDTFGQIVSEKDRNANVRYFTYDTRGNHTSTKWPDVTVRYYDYTDAGEAEKIVDELANASYFNYDKRGRITTWKDFLGQVTQHGFDNRNNRTILVDRRSNAWYWEYDGLSRTDVARTALLNTSYFNYNTCNLLAATVDPRSKPMYFYYDGFRRLIAQENALKEITYFEYTLAGQIERVKDARDITVYYTFDCRHRPTSFKDGLGDVTYYDYDLIGYSTVVTDPRNNVSYANFDELYRIASTRNALNQSNYFYYDAEGNRTCSEDPLQHRSYFYFDSLNRVSCAEDAQANRTYFTYEQRSHVNSQRDARSNVTYFFQDKLGRSFATRDARANIAYVEFDPESEVIASKDSRGNTSYFTFDADRRPISAKTPLAEISYLAYDAAANPTSQKDPRGNLGYLYYDDINRVICAEDAKQARVYFTYDASGNGTSVKDPLSRVAYFDFDRVQRIFVSRDPLAGLRYFTYDAASNNDSIKDERGNVGYLYFDAVNRLFASRSAVNAVGYFEFDKVGNLTSTKDPISRLNYFYFDTLNRLQTVEDGLQRRSYFEYDAVWNPVSIKNARSVAAGEVGIRYFTYDALDRRSSYRNEVGNVSYFDYDAASNLFVQRNPLGAFTYWEFDADNRTQSEKDALARTCYWTYDPAWNTSSLKDKSGEVTYYQYDSINLSSRIDYPDVTNHYFEYDLAREATAFADSSGRTTLGYDALSRVTSRTNPGSFTLYYDYDPVSNTHVFVDTSGMAVYYRYDAINRTAEVDVAYGSQPYGQTPYGGPVTYYEYDLADQLVHERRANGTITYFGYDVAGRVTLQEHRKSDGTIIQSWTNTLDEAGNPVLMIRGSDSTRVYFNFDAAGRVTTEAWRTSGGANIYGFTYQYDDAGNRNRKTNLAGVHTYWDYDIADQATIQKNAADTRVYFTYDTSGHLAVEHDVDASAGRTYYTYDPRCLLTKIDFPGATPTNYFYWNALKERIRKDDSTGGKTYTWEGPDVILERDLAGAVTQRIVIGNGGAVFQQVGTSGVWPHKNQVGSTVRHTNDAQTIVNYYEYDVWGQPLETTQGTTQQYRYKGAEVDPDAIGFNSNNARYNFGGKAYVPFRGNVLQGSACCSDGGTGPLPDGPPPHDLPFGPIDSFGPWMGDRIGRTPRSKNWPQPRPVDIGIGGSAGGDGGTTTGGNGSGGGFGPGPGPGPFAGPAPYLGPSILVPYNGPRPGSERKVWCQEILDLPLSSPLWDSSDPWLMWLLPHFGLSEERDALKRQGQLGWAPTGFKNAGEAAASNYNNWLAHAEWVTTVTYVGPKLLPGFEYTRMPSGVLVGIRKSTGWVLFEFGAELAVTTAITGPAGTVLSLGRYAQYVNRGRQAFVPIAEEWDEIRSELM